MAREKKVINSIGLIASAGVGVAEKVCAFVMLVPSAFKGAAGQSVPHRACHSGVDDRADCIVLCLHAVAEETI
ncbi:MAG: hypothetical protein IJ239_04775 [Eubacterium sp.]|nr:hypothetical protein [Eubacterium sp.]